MPNGNGRGPMGAGSKTGRGRGFCNGSAMPGTINRESEQDQTAEQQMATIGCRGPQGCGTGIKKGNGGGKGAGRGNKRSQL